jgi:succinate dehydrogenase membrane anchor subunit
MRLLKQFGTQSGGSSAWIWQRLTGLVLVITLLLHYLYLHIFNHGMVTYFEVTNRLASPLWKTIDLTFLAAALYHSVTGVIMSIHDYIHRPGLRITLVSLVWVIAAVLFVTGVATIATFRAY